MEDSDIWTKLVCDVVELARDLWTTLEKPAKGMHGEVGDGSTGGRRGKVGTFGRAPQYEETSELCMLDFD